MNSGLLRIKSKTLPVVDKAPKPPLQPHLLCSPPCSLLASDLASPLILGEALFSYFKVFALLLPLPGEPPSFPPGLHMTDPSGYWGSTQASLLKWGLPGPSKPNSTSHLLCSLSCISFMLFTALIITWNYLILFVYLFIDSLFHQTVYSR